MNLPSRFDADVQRIQPVDVAAPRPMRGARGGVVVLGLGWKFTHPPDPFPRRAAGLAADRWWELYHTEREGSPAIA